LPVAQQIIDKIEEAVQQGRTSLRMQLNPKDLGMIDIRLVSQGHSVSITLIAEHAGTSQLLEKQMEQLRANLADAGINLANVNVGHQSTNGQPGSNLLERPTPEYVLEGGSDTANSKPESGIVSHLNRAGMESRVDYRI
jgi:flagellar hook-length control protein FliK